MTMKKLLFIGIESLKNRLIHYQNTLTLRVIEFTEVPMVVKLGVHTGTKFMITQHLRIMLDGNPGDNMIYVVLGIAVIVYIQTHFMKVIQMGKSVIQIVLM